MANTRTLVTSTVSGEPSPFSDSGFATAEQQDDAPKIAIPVPCEDDIFQNGHTVFVISGWKNKYIETWVQEVAKRSGEKVDWHYSGGRANILGLGDFEKIRNTIKEMLPELNKGINQYNQSKYGKSPFFQPVTYTAENVDQWKNREVFRSCFLETKPK